MIQDAPQGAPVHFYKGPGSPAHAFGSRRVSEEIPYLQEEVLFVFDPLASPRLNQ